MGFGDEPNLAAVKALPELMVVHERLTDNCDLRMTLTEMFDELTGFVECEVAIWQWACPIVFLS